MNKVISVTKYVADNLKRTHTCVKILYVGILITGLLAILTYVSFYYYINSGGLNVGNVLLVFFGCWAVSFSFLLFGGVCVILSFFKPPRITNLILSIIGVIFLYFINGVCTAPAMNKFFGEPKEKEMLRYIAHNIMAMEELKNLSKKMVFLTTKNYFIFTEQSVKDLSCPNVVNHDNNLFPPDFDFNKNLLGIAPNQISPDTVILFQSSNEAGVFAGPNDISADWHYGKGSLVLFGDGRIEFVKKEDFKNLRWQP